MDETPFDTLDQARETFLTRIPERYRGVACNYFLEPPRTTGVTDPSIVVAQVTQKLQDKIDRASYDAREHPWSRHSLSNLEALAKAIRHDPSGALTLAAWAIAYVALPAEQRQSRKLSQREWWASKAMAGKAPTSKQLAYLTTLGYTGEITDRQHASTLIDQLTKGTADAR